MSVASLIADQRTFLRTATRAPLRDPVRGRLALLQMDRPREPTDGIAAVPTSMPGLASRKFRAGASNSSRNASMLSCKDCLRSPSVATNGTQSCS